jgi:hypothetical protein
VGYEGKKAPAVESLVMDWVQYTATKDKLIYCLHHHSVNGICKLTINKECLTFPQRPYAASNIRITQFLSLALARSIPFRACKSSH